MFYTIVKLLAIVQTLLTHLFRSSQIRVCPVCSAFCFELSFWIYQLIQIQLNFSGSNTFGTMKMLELGVVLANEC